MDETAQLLAVGQNGSINLQPLLKFDIRYDATSCCWRRITPFHIQLPYKLARARVAEEVGVPVKSIHAWEDAVHRANVKTEETPIDLLRVHSDGTIDRDPLRRWNFRYHPQSRVWRRSRASRNEVSRAVVARNVNVPAELIEAWENAANTAWAVHSGKLAEHTSC